MRKREDKLNRVGKSFTGEDKLEIKLELFCLTMN